MGNRDSSNVHLPLPEQGFGALPTVLTDIDQAKNLANEKPIFVLSKDFEQSAPLFQPLIIEVIESHFIPVLISEPSATIEVRSHNGEQEIWKLKIDAEETVDLINDKENLWTYKIVEGIIRSLRVLSKTIPTYIESLSQELNPNKEKATFCMYCFWTGEVKLGSIPGVVGTRAGFLGWGEVVEVQYDPQRLQYEELVKQAIRSDQASSIYTHTPQQDAILNKSFPKTKHSATTKLASNAPMSDQKRQLRFSSIAWIPLTPFQAVQVNAALGSSKRVENYLSPKQLQIAAKLQNISSANLQPITKLEKERDKTWLDIRALPAYYNALVTLLQSSDLMK